MRVYLIPAHILAAQTLRFLAQARRTHRNMQMLATVLVAVRGALESRCCLSSRVFVVGQGGLLVAMRVRIARGVPAIAPIGFVRNPHATIGFVTLAGIALQTVGGIIKASPRKPVIFFFRARGVLSHPLVPSGRFEGTVRVIVSGVWTVC